METKLPEKRKGFKSKLLKRISRMNKKQLVLFFIFVFGMLGATLFNLQTISNNFSQKIPSHGGKIKEGIVGTPRFINPVLASLETDKDITSLVFAGLVKKDINGNIVGDLAETYTISEDGKTYTFKIKDYAFFHNGDPVTTDDVIYTINKIKDPIIKSPLRASWEGVTIEKIDDKNLLFKLNQPYISFLEKLSIGIISENFWSGVSSQEFTLDERNLKPIGAGPFKITGVKTKNKNIVKYTLKSYGDYTLGRPYINKIKLKFFKNEDNLVRALRSGKVSQAGAISPEQAEELNKKRDPELVKLSRVFALFFNQSNNNILGNDEVIRAMELVIDKNRIINEVLRGYGEVATSPIINGIEDVLERDRNELLAEAAGILEKEGYSSNSSGVREKDGNRLSFTISTGNTAELQKTAEIIKEELAEIGISVELKIFDLGDLNQDIIRNRDFEILLFGQVISNESDLFAFWHSSQRSDPGLNITGYSNSEVDKLLEEIVTNYREEDQSEKISSIIEKIKGDRPAIFLYYPEYIYFMSPKVKGENITKISEPRERFSSINSWYIFEDRVWEFFLKF